jgi:hypothetical protein
MVKRIVVDSRAGRQRSLGVHFTDAKLTSHGGLAPLKAFMDKVGLRRRLDRGLGHQDGRRYSACEILELLVAGKVVGDTRLRHLERFGDDDTVRYLFDLPAVPVATTVSRLLERFDEDDVRRLEDVSVEILREHLLKGRRSITVDIDATVLPVWGKQEGTAKGYNPTRRGGRSYFPNLAFDAKTGLSLLGLLRPGNRSSIGPVGEIEGFLERLFDDVIPHIPNVRVRMDSGYFGDRMLRQLEERGVRYVISARGRRTLDFADRIRWSRPRQGIQYGEATYACVRWGKERRFLVRRDTRKPAQILFNGLWESDIVVVTNMKGRPKKVIDFYNHRGTAEQFIAEGKQSWGLGTFISGKLLPNRVDFCLTLLAMNLLIGYREQLLPPHLRRHRPATIRRLFVNVAARLVRHGRRVSVHYGRALPSRQTWAIILDQLSRGPPLRTAAC